MSLPNTMSYIHCFLCVSKIFKICFYLWRQAPIACAARLRILFVALLETLSYKGISCVVSPESFLNWGIVSTVLTETLVHDGIAPFVRFEIILYGCLASFVLQITMWFPSAGSFAELVSCKKFVNETNSVLSFILHPATWAFSIFSQFSFIFFIATTSALMRWLSSDILLSS